MSRCFFILVWLFSGTAAVADDDLACLGKTLHQVVQWDHEWQRDKQDHGVRYRVLNVSESQPRQGPKAYVIQLQAIGAAQQPLRTATITKDLAARLFCDRTEWGDYRDRNLTTEVIPRTNNTPLKEVEEIYPVRDALPSDVPFRRLSDHSWVPARAPEGASLKWCSAGGAMVACAASDRASTEQDTERRIRATLPKVTVLSRPFLRHTSGGWKVDDPADLPADQPFSICTVSTREFSCLSDEKRRFASELREAERLAELEQRVFPPVAPKSKSNAAAPPRRKRR